MITYAVYAGMYVESWARSGWTTKIVMAAQQMTLCQALQDSGASATLPSEMIKTRIC